MRFIFYMHICNSFQTLTLRQGHTYSEGQGHNDILLIFYYFNAILRKDVLENMV